MNRRQFLAASLIGGLMLAVGLRPRILSLKEPPPAPISVWIKNGEFSYDRGETWTKAPPHDNTRVERWFPKDGESWAEQTNPHYMPTYQRVLSKPPNLGVEFKDGEVQPHFNRACFVVRQITEGHA